MLTFSPREKSSGWRAVLGNTIYQLVFCLLLGAVMGVLFRIYPKRMSSLYLNPSHFKFLGSLFISLVRMLVSPLIFSSVFNSIVSIDDTRKTSRLFGFSMLIFLVMTVISVLVSVLVMVKLQVGSGVKLDLASLMQGDGVTKFSSNAVVVNSFGDFILTLVPTNINEAFRTDNFLHIIFFAAATAFTSVSLGARAAPFVGFVGALSEILLRLSSAFSRVAPLGIFGFSFWIVGTQDVVLLKSLLKFIGVVYGVCLFLCLVLYPGFMLLAMRLNPLPMIIKIFPAQVMSYFLSSGSAVLPTSIRIAEEGLGVSEGKARFVIPIGATLNMNGGAVYISASALFIAQLLGVDLTISQYVMLVLLSTIAAVGTAPIPGSAIFLLAGVLLSLNLPVAAVGILLAVDRLLDMIRTTANVTGDIFSSVIISFYSNDFSKDIYNSRGKVK